MLENRGHRSNRLSTYSLYSYWDEVCILLYFFARNQIDERLSVNLSFEQCENENREGIRSVVEVSVLWSAFFLFYLWQSGEIRNRPDSGKTSLRKWGLRGSSWCYWGFRALKCLLSIFIVDNLVKLEIGPILVKHLFENLAIYIFYGIIGLSVLGIESLPIVFRAICNNLEIGDFWKQISIWRMVWPCWGLIFCFPYW